MWTVFATLLLLAAPNGQAEEDGAVPAVTAVGKETVRGIVASLGVAVGAAGGGGGGGGGGGVTMTVAVRFAVNPPVSSTSMVTLSLPGTANWCCAMALCDHGVSQTRSFSQSHRIGSRFDGSWRSNEVDVNVKTVPVSPVAGVQLKSAYGGVFVG